MGKLCEAKKLMNTLLEIVITSSAAKSVKNLDTNDKKRIYDAIKKLCYVPPQGDVKKLKGYNKIMRCRVGNSRIIFEQNMSANELIIYKIDSRSKVYK